MRVLLLSDIHSNIEALEAVLDQSPPSTYDQLLVLGDLVGYGANPNEVVDRIFELEPDIIIRGNHDKVSTGVEGTDTFSRVAGEAARWTNKTLSPENLKRIAALPAGPKNVDRDVEICHGTPFDEDTYVLDENDATKSLAMAHRHVCFFGHTHIPIAYVQKPSGLTIRQPTPAGPETTVIHLDKSHRYLVNPGSVGQPRDTDPRASYAVYDSKKTRIELKRVAYRIELAQQRITESGLPESLAFRLGLGR